MSTAVDIARALKGRKSGRGWVAKCPAHDDHTPSLSIRDAGDKVLVKCHAGCAQEDVIEALRARGLWADNGNTPQLDPVERKLAKIRREERRCAEEAATAADIAKRHETAVFIWDQTKPIQGTVVEIYLKGRGIHISPLPATLRYLPARPPKYPFPAMVAAYGLATEPEPDLVTISRAHIRAVHLTQLASDGQSKAPGVDVPKRMIGRPSGSPIALANVNDGLGLAVGEGIETMLSYHQATGLGAWAAGAAGFMPALADAVPDYVECVTVCSEADPAGERHALELADRLAARGFEVLMAEASHGSPRL